MKKQITIRETTSRVFTKTIYVKVGSILLLLYLASLTSILVNASPIRIKNGDWIRYDSINIGEVPFDSQTAWSKVEFLNVTASKATVRITMNRTDGTQRIRTTIINVDSDKSSSGFSGFIIPTDLNVGDAFRVSGWGNVTIMGETMKTYAGASRTVVYAPYSESEEADDPEVETISYWDKQTGVFLEETVSTDKYTMSFKATKTNIWSAPALGGLDCQLLVITIIPVAIVTAVSTLVLRKRKRPASITSAYKDNPETSSGQPAVSAFYGYGCHNLESFQDIDVFQ